MILGGDFHAPLSGIAHEARSVSTVPATSRSTCKARCCGPTSGISGPLAERFEVHAPGEPTASPAMRLSFVPGLTAEEVDQDLIDAIRDRPHHNASTEVARAFGLVQAVALRVVEIAVGRDEALRRLTREQRRALVLALTAFPLNVIDGRGYNFAEVTSGGVSLDEVNPKTMESRLRPGLYFVGEILDVDGRIGGFNFSGPGPPARWPGRRSARGALGTSAADRYVRVRAAAAKPGPASALRPHAVWKRPCRRHPLQRRLRPQRLPPDRPRSE